MLPARCKNKLPKRFLRKEGRQQLIPLVTPQIQSILLLSAGEASQLAELQQILKQADDVLGDIASDANKLSSALDLLDPSAHSLGWLHLLCVPSPGRETPHMRRGLSTDAHTPPRVQGCERGNR